MNRRSFLSLLSVIPFIGRFVQPSAKPPIQEVFGWVVDHQYSYRGELKRVTILIECWLGDEPIYYEYWGTGRFRWNKVWKKTKETLTAEELAKLLVQDYKRDAMQVLSGAVTISHAPGEPKTQDEWMRHYQLLHDTVHCYPLVKGH